MPRNVFVLGADPPNMDLLRSVRAARDCRFHVLADAHRAKGGGTFPAAALLGSAREALDAFAGPIDAIVGWWDFPVSTLLPVLRREYGTPGATLESTLRLEHKYWSRLEQARCLTEHVPAFRVFDPFEADPLARIDLPFPFWVKPVKSVSSYLGFEVRDRADFARALVELRTGIVRLAEPFDLILAHAVLPPEIVPVGGRCCLAEALISQGRQCTLEGYVHEGRTTVYGVIDSMREGERGSSFSRYQYPSTLPASVQGRMAEVCERLMTHVGYDMAPFDAEFYWNDRDDGIWLLEVNARVSKSHAPLFEMVDGESHHGVALALALGERPDPPHRAGRWPLAAKFMLRRERDAVVTRVPDRAQVTEALAGRPGARLELHVQEGTRLSELPQQDSYSFEIAELHLGADDEASLLRGYGEVVERLDLDLAREAA